MSNKIKIKEQILKQNQKKGTRSSFSYSSFANTKDNIKKVARTKQEHVNLSSNHLDVIEQKTNEYKLKQQQMYKDRIYVSDIAKRQKFKPIEFVSPLGGRSNKPQQVQDEKNFHKNINEKIKKSNAKLTNKILLNPQIANEANDDVSISAQVNKIVQQPIVDKQENKKVLSNVSEFDFIGEQSLEEFKGAVKKSSAPAFIEDFQENGNNLQTNTKYFDDSYKVYESFIEKVSKTNLTQNDYLTRKARLINKNRRHLDVFTYFKDEEGFVFSNATRVFKPEIMPNLVQQEPELVKIDEDVKHYTDSIENEFLTARKNHKENTKRIMEHNKNNAINNSTNFKSETSKIEKTQNLKIENQNTPALTNYTLPSLALLNAVNNSQQSTAGLKEKIEQLETFFKNFKISARVEHSTIGPTVARFELSIAAGTKVSKISNLKDDIKLALASKDVRIEAPIPGKNLIGIEIPAMKSRTINIKELIQSNQFKQGGKLEAALGLSIDNYPTFLDIASMPHGLISGSTGSGKSVSINALLISLLYKNTPEDLRLILVDPKVVELSPYNGIPHLLSPVISDPKEALNSLKWAAQEMDRRYNLFATTNTRNLEAYNKIANKKLPKIVIIIDELADLMMVASNDVEIYITRIAQKSRAAGIHMILATQRPSVEVITGLIKANIPTRIAFAVSSSIDSRTILDQVGAESLLGKGDMLFSERGKSPIRLQAPYITDDEISSVIAHWQNYRGGEVVDFNETQASNESEAKKVNFDPDLDQIAEFVITSQRASTSLIQRKFSFGYNKAARLIDQLEELGVIGQQNGTKPREVFLDYEQYLEKRRTREGD